jgi:hypothetical protein
MISPKSAKPVTPAHAGVQNLLILLDSRFCGMTEYLYSFPGVFGRSKGNKLIPRFLKVISFFGNSL